MVMRLDHKKAQFPAPSEDLFEGMAQTAHREFVELWSKVRDRKQAKAEGPLLKWEQMGDDRRMVWCSAMRAVWKHMALAGGAKRKRVS